MRYLDTLYAVYYDLEDSQALFNRAAVRTPAARELLCAFRDADMALLGRLQREIASVECKVQPASILLPEQE